MGIDAIVSYADLQQARQALITEDKEQKAVTDEHNKCKKDIVRAVRKLSQYLSDQQDLAERDPQYNSYNYKNPFNRSLEQLLEIFYARTTRSDIDFSDFTPYELQVCLRSLQAVDSFIEQPSYSSYGQLTHMLSEIEQRADECSHIIDKHNLVKTIARKVLGVGLVAGSVFFAYQIYQAFRDGDLPSGSLSQIGGTIGCIVGVVVGGSLTVESRPRSFQHNLNLFKQAAVDVLEDAKEEKNYFQYSA